MTRSINLFELWQNPPSIYRSAPFWSWNSKLEPRRLTDEIEEMHRAGMGGFFMHSRYGLKTPYLGEEWFQCVAACVQKARQLEMKAYLYDEDRWPSGSASGLVTRDNEAYRRHMLKLTMAGQPVQEKHVSKAGWGASPGAASMAGLPVQGEHVAAFSLKLDGRGRLQTFAPIEPDAFAAAKDGAISLDLICDQPRGWYNDGTHVDTMNGEAIAEFIRVTHQAYADRCGKEFGKVIPAIFFDEPSIAGPWTDKQFYFVPWTAQLPREFISRRGYDIRERLPELFYAPAEGEFSKVRYDFWRTLTELFVENFTRRIGQWCDTHGIALTGHVLGEETLRRQISQVGATMPHYEHMHWPGIDILGDQADELSTARQTTSVADQLGKQRVLSELYGVTGWDWPLEGHKFVGDWQFAIGVNFRCPHLTHYSLAGGAKRDYPASIFSHSPWWPYYSVVEDYFARLGVMLTQGTPVRDLLVIHPVESGWGVMGPGSEQTGHPMMSMQEQLDRITRTLCGEHYDWDYGDESLLAKYAKAAGKALKVGQMTYQLVVVPPSLTLRATTVALLRKLLAAGGNVLFIGERPSRVDAKESTEIADLAGAATCGAEEGEFISAIEAIVPRRVSITEHGRQQRCLWAMLRKTKDGQILFVQSHDRKAPHRLTVSVQGRQPAVLWDLQSGVKTRLHATSGGDRVEFELELPPTGSAVVTLGMAVADAAKPSPARTVVERKELQGPWPVELAEPNTFPLDYCRFRVGAEPLGEAVPSLKADTLIRERFGLGPRLNNEHQPWYLYSTGVVDMAARGPCRIARSFHVTDVPARCALALEQPENFTIKVNGKKARPASGSWLDPDIRTVDITSQVRKGDNEIVLDFNYRPDMELEDMYLVGEFAVAKRAAGVAGPGGYTLTSPVRTLTAGSWVGQGLDFYGGAVRHRLEVTKPKRGERLVLSLPQIACTAAAVHVNDKTFVLPWAPFAADITGALCEGANKVIVEVIGGRHNIMGPLHVPWKRWTGPPEFQPDNPDWTPSYLLVDHGLMGPVVLETMV